MVRIRLRRTGAKKQPHYRVVVADARSPRDGRFIETIGHYNPRTEPPTIEIDAGRALYWLSVGAQPSEAVKRMLDKLGVMARAAAIKKGEVPSEAEALAEVAAELPEAEAEVLAEEEEELPVEEEEDEVEDDLELDVKEDGDLEEDQSAEDDE